MPTLLCGCAGSSGYTTPARPERVATLEEVRPEDREALAKAESQLDAGRPQAALELLEPLIPQNQECASLVILLRRAIGELPEGTRGDVQARWFQRFRELERQERRSGDRDANLAFACALFAPNPDEEFDWLRRAEGRDGRHYYAVAKLGEAYWRGGELNDARQLLERAVSLQPDLPEAWLVLAAVEQDAGRLSNAARHYRTYLERRPLDRAVALRYVRLLLHELGRPGDAAPILEALERAEPGQLEVGLDIAAMHWLQGEPQKAEAKYLEMLREHPTDVRLLINLGNVYFAALQRPAKALQVYRYLRQLPTEASLTTFGEQLLFVPERIRRLEEQLGASAPPPPESWRDLL